MTEAEIKKAVWDFFALPAHEMNAALHKILSASAAAGVVPEAAQVSSPPPIETEPAAEPLPPGTTTSQTDLEKQAMLRLPNIRQKKSAYLIRF